MSTIKILIVEDEPDIAELLSVAMQQAGYETERTDSSRAARQVLAEQHFSLALVDWMLPGGSGLELVRYIRATETLRDMAVIMVTARTGEADITHGLDAGADDYITKPFSPRELQSRIKALLRRTIGAAEQALVVGALHLDPPSHRVWCQHSKAATETDAPVEEQDIALNHTEFKLLKYMMAHPERVYSRAQLLDGVWGPGTFIEERTVDVHILRLRKALKTAGLDSAIETVRGAGYRIIKT